MTLQGKQVELTRDAPGIGANVILRGMSGRCEWDEGGVDVIVEFNREVPNGGMLSNKKQAWVPRHFLKIVQ